MKNLTAYFSYLIMCISISACTDSGPESQATLNDIKFVNTRSDLRVELYTEDGKLVNNASMLLPNTQYAIKINTDIPMSFAIRRMDGMELVNEPNDKWNLTSNTLLEVRTEKTLNKQLFVSLIPIHYQETELVKEMPQLFLLPLK